MTRILLTGIAGQLGQELKQTLAPLGEVTGVDRQTLDLAQPDKIRQWVGEVKPDLIVNAAAYTAVDKAESEPELANAINGTAPSIMAEEAQRLGAALIHVSTDYVFDGQKNTPYTEDDTPNPINTYGHSKLLGEEGVCQNCDRYIILRTAWVYGIGGKGNFVKTMLRLGAEREELRVVVDQIGTPTWTGDLAQIIAQLGQKISSESNSQDLGTRPPSPHAIKSEASSGSPLKKVGGGGSVKGESVTTPPRIGGLGGLSQEIGVSPDSDRISPGIYHFTNSGAISWYDFAIAIFEEAQQIGFPVKVQQVVPITTPEYPTPAPRPAYSVLSHQKISTVLGTHPPHWRTALRQMLKQLYAEQL